MGRHDDEYLPVLAITGRANYGLLVAGCMVVGALMAL